MSRIYAGGVAATAIANITADIATFISIDAQGVKRLDVAGAVQYLQAQFAAISTDAEYVAPATAASSAAAARTVDTQALVDALNSVIRPEHWQALPEYPTTTGVLSGATLVTAIKTAIADTAQRSATITSYYDALDNDLDRMLSEYFDRAKISDQVPQGVQRIIRAVFGRFTWVTDRGEESAPSAVAAKVELDQNDTLSWTIPSVPAGRSITHFRPYRSAVGNDSTAWRMVPNASDANGWPVGTLTITDTRTDEELTDVLQTQLWAEPPADLADVVAGPNGMLVGHRYNTNEVCFSVNTAPAAPYAWPVAYRRTTQWPIVGKGVFGSTTVILTRGRPYYATGPDSSSVDFQPIESDQPCVSRRSIVNIPAKGDYQGGVGYASASGYCVADAGGVRVITGKDGFDLFDHETWAALTPSSMVCQLKDGVLLILYNNGAAGCYALDLATGKLTTTDLVASALYRDMATDTLYYASGTAIASFATAGTKRSAQWKSPLVVLPAYSGFAWLQADSNYEATVTLKLYANGSLHSTTSLASRTPVRAKPGRDREWQIEVDSAARVTSATAAASTEELKEL